ncbi:MAG: alpha/beta hydrolase [Sphingomonadaceae bacterium]|nr:alpha/beta hydrolase [Sphingomonadaceae bacterium]
MNDATYTDGYFWSRDGLRLHYRDFAGPAERAPVLCIPGLTRNVRDFEGLAGRLAGHRRVICVSLRGRGESAFAKDALSYVPLTYLQDVQALIEELKLERLVSIGTSLGGLITMLLAATQPGLLAGAVLNDIGPEIAPEGLARIKSYVGKGGNWPTWMHAARDIAAGNATVYPRYEMTDWLRMAKQLCRVASAGRIVWDYDARIAEPFRLPGGEVGVDLWPALDALGEVPVLSLRGALSDVFAQATQAEMARRLPHLTAVEVPDVGHAPTLDEPVAIAAIERFLAVVA